MEILHTIYVMAAIFCLSGIVVMVFWAFDPVHYVKCELSHFRWYRKLVGGNWEQWRVDHPVCSHVWFHNNLRDFDNKPGGLIRDRLPLRLEWYGGLDEIKELLKVFNVECIPEPLFEIISGGDIYLARRDTPSCTPGEVSYRKGATVRVACVMPVSGLENRVMVRAVEVPRMGWHPGHAEMFYIEDFREWFERKR